MRGSRKGIFYEKKKKRIDNWKLVSDLKEDGKRGHMGINERETGI